MHEVCGSIPRVANEIFRVGGVRSLVQSVKNYPSRSFLASPRTILDSHNMVHKGAISEHISVWGIRGCKTADDDDLGIYFD